MVVFKTDFATAGPGETVVKRCSTAYTADTGGQALGIRIGGCGLEGLANSLSRES